MFFVKVFCIKRPNLSQSFPAIDVVDHFALMSY